MKSGILWITLAAAALLAAAHLFPGKAGLAPADFTAGGPDALEFCDPANPRFLPVLSKSSPVAMTLAPAKPARAGAEARVALELRTASGRPIGPSDLASAPGGKLRLWLIDAGLGDFQRAAPRPGASAGLWNFAFTPRSGGLYRVFADFTPEVTGREMYVSADLPVAAGPGPGAAAAPAVPSSGPELRAGYAFTLVPSQTPVFARQAVTLTVAISRPGGGMVPLVPLAGAFAHLAAFDSGRTGFASLAEDDPAAPPDPFHPRAAFRVTFADPGRYVLWGSVRLGGREVAVPFALRVLP